MEPIVNKVSQSGLITIDLEMFHESEARMSLDIKDQLYMGLMLKEKEFRDFIKSNDWSIYRGAIVNVFCSTDAIVPTWAYMLISNKLSGIAKSVFFGTQAEYDTMHYLSAIDAMDLESYKDQRVVVKGCSKYPVPVSAYVHLTEKLTPLVKSIMYGEPCSTVPIYKKA